MDVGQLTASLSLNIKQFVNSINDAMSHVRGLSNNMNNAMGPNMQNNINTTRRNLDALAGNFKDLDRIVSGIIISQMFYNTLNSIEQATRAVVGFKNEMEKAQISLEYFLGSADDAQGFIMNMKDFAASTSFSTEQAIRLSRRLMGAQFRPEQIRQVMEILNDANAVTGATAEQMDRIVLAITQMRTNGKIAGQELRQLAEAGIPVYRLLQEELGLTAEQLARIGDLNISGDVGVAAILRGLEKRYAGAAERIAQTVPGMWETIRDNLLFLSEEVFEIPYRALEGFLRRWRNALEDARKIMTQQGLGGVFEHFVPPELQDSIRRIIAGLQSLGATIKSWWSTLKPILTSTGEQIIKVLGDVLPVLSAIVGTITRITEAIIKANPWVQFFVGAIASMMIAGTVSKALMFLWSVTRMGVIAAAVGQAVMLLAKALQFLFVVLARNPIVGILTVLAGALLYLAMSSKTVTQWLDALQARLARLSGLDISGILRPEDNKSLDEWTDKFNQSLDDMQQGLKDVGKNAEKAGKKIKDTFIASFDEVYQIPDKLDDVGEGLDEIGKMPDLPKLPELPNVTLPDIDLDTPGADDDDDGPFVPPVVGRPGDGDGGSQPPTIPPPNISPVTEAIATVEALILGLRAKLQEAFSTVSSWITNVASAVAQVLVPIQQFILTLNNALVAVQNWTLSTAAAFADWSIATLATFGNWVVTTAAAIEGWAARTSAALTKWIADTATSLVKWSADTAKTIASWVANAATAIERWALQTVTIISQWSAQTFTMILTWVANTLQAIGQWSASTLQIFATWTSNVIQALQNWATQTSNTISTWVANTLAKIKTWASDTLNTIKLWIAETINAFTQWATNTLENFQKWVEAVIKSISEWSAQTAEAIRTWAIETAQHIYNWGVNTGSNIVAWVNSGISNIASWATTTYATIATWINNSAAAFANWVGNVSSNIAAWGNNFITAIDNWASSTWDAFGNWLKGTANSVYDWASGTLDTILGWARSVWNAIAGLASEAGQTLGKAFNFTISGLSRAAINVGNWVSANKNWLIPVAVGAAVVGGAIAIAASGGAAAPALAPLLALRTGGIVDRDQIVRIGEGNKREAVIPLENSTYMRPFSAAVANDLLEMLGESLINRPEVDPRPILYVGTLIADDRSLRELERRMRLIRISEAQRSAEV